MGRDKERGTERSVLGLSGITLAKLHPATQTTLLYGLVAFATFEPSPAHGFQNGNDGFRKPTLHLLQRGSPPSRVGISVASALRSLPRLLDRCDGAASLHTKYTASLVAASRFCSIGSAPTAFSLLTRSSLCSLLPCFA